MEKRFEIGEVVQLKSGGARMTVENDNDPFGRIPVVWLDGSGIVQREMLRPEVLRPVVVHPERPEPTSIPPSLVRMDR